MAEPLNLEAHTQHADALTPLSGHDNATVIRHEVAPENAKVRQALRVPPRATARLLWRPAARGSRHTGAKLAGLERRPWHAVPIYGLERGEVWRPEPELKGAIHTAIRDAQAPWEHEQKLDRAHEGRT